MSSDEKIVNVDALASQLTEHRDGGEVVVQCHGCFDIVHPGHIRYLRYARSLGDRLVVSITSDNLIDKGYDRPYIHQELRAENLAALEFVDYVCIDGNATATSLLETLKPDIYVKGKEYELSTDPRFLAERNTVESYGGQVIFSSGDVVFSSTRLLERVRQELPMEAEKTRAFCRAHDITMSSLQDLLESLQALNIVVVGDAILDRYLHCEEMSIASESPVISVSPVEEQMFAGGAGLIAGQLVELGAHATLVTTLGEGGNVGSFTQQLADNGVALKAQPSKVRPLFVKTRYLVEGKKVFKVNEGRRSPLPHDENEMIAASVDALLADADLLLVTDFGYGFFGASLIQRLVESARHHDVPYVVDVSSSGASNLLKFRTPTIATPTEDELRFAFGDLDSGLSHLAARYYQETQAKNLYITMGRRGALYFAPPAAEGARLSASYLPAFNRYPIDTVGAGDVFLCATSLSKIAGVSPQQAMYLGNALAGLHVSELGNSPNRRSAFLQFLRSRPELLPDR